ncbi:hypothetical protein WICPIJ_001415 [Wickerhamomyces pijperi]|uniref:RRM domain-containing protein n=1 Tax=Wickerhamomyces pijperi TaxID=599730 RepID=A0A9P8TQR5_WICPI|nr:hypothetical protein WICPIJ_001415 [Wickerhamomyces pijperi]
MAAKKPANTLASRLRAAAPKTKASTTNTKQAKAASTNPLAKRIAVLSSKEDDKKKKNNQSDGKSKKVNPLLAALSNATSKKTQNETSKQKKPSTNKKAPLKIGKAQPNTRSKTTKKPSLQILSSKSKESATVLQISNLSHEIPYADLFRFLSTTYGPLLSLKTQDLASGSQIASASFLDIQDMYRCEKELKEREVDGRVLTVKRISEPASPGFSNSGGSMNPYPTAGYYNPYAAAVMQFAAAPPQHMTQEQMLVQAQFQRINGATSGVNTADSGESNPANGKKENSRQRDTKGSKGNKKSQDLSSRIGRK